MKNRRSNDSNFILLSIFAHCYMHIYQIITAVDPSIFLLTQPMHFVPLDSSCLRRSSSDLIKAITSYLKTYCTLSGGILSEEQS